jgi:hypothetical protein
MRISSFVLIVGMVCSQWSWSAGQTECSGRVTEPGGGSLRAAYVLLLSADRASVLKSVQAMQDCTFRISLPHRGFWVLRFMGVGFAPHDVVLYVPDKKPICVDVALGCLRYLDGEGELSVIGDFNLWKVSNAVVLKKGNDGKYSAGIPSANDHITFRVRGYRDAEGVEGIRGASYVLNREYTLDAIVKTDGGVAHVEVDPDLLDRSNTSARVTFTKGSGQTQRIAAAVRTWWDGEQAHYSAQIDAAMGRIPAGGASSGWSDLVASLWEQAEAETESLSRSVCCLAYVSTALNLRQKDPAAVTKCMEHLSAISPVWALNPKWLSPVVRNTSWSAAVRERYLQTAMSRHPERAVRLAVLYSEFKLAFDAEDNAKAARYYDLLTGKYGDTPVGKQVRKEYPKPEPSAKTK